MVQSDVKDAVKQLARRAQAANPSAGHEYMGGDGLMYCSVCGEPVQQRIRQNIFFPDGIVPCQCRCVRELIARDLAEEGRQGGAGRRNTLRNCAAKGSPTLRMHGRHSRRITAVPLRRELQRNGMWIISHS